MSPNPFRRQRSITIIKTSLALGILMCLGFAYLMFEIMAL